MTPLQILPLAETDRSARVADFGWLGPGAAFALSRGARGQVWLARSSREGDSRIVDRFSARGGLRALDRTRFTWDDAQFVEAEKYRAAGGPNLHAAPIVLPAVVEIGRPHAPIEGLEAAVTALYAGPVELRLGRHRARLRALCLRASAGDERRVEWLGEGVGELSLGPEGAPPERWLIAWAGNARRLLARVPSELQTARLPELPEASEETPGRSVF